MAKVRTAARVDGNHAKVLQACRAIGATVLDTHQLPNCFDALIGYRGREFIFEIKDEAQPKSKRKLTPGEKGFADTWRGSKYHIIESPAQAIQVLTTAPQISKTPINFPPYESTTPHTSPQLPPRRPLRAHLQQLQQRSACSCTCSCSAGAGSLAGTDRPGAAL